MFSRQNASPNPLWTPNGPRRSATDYRSRGVRVRLFALVAALMAVLVAMNEARRPANWNWLFLAGRPASPAPQIDTRVPGQPTSGSRTPSPLGPTVLAPSPRIPPHPNTLVPAEDDPQESNQRGWQAVWNALSLQERNLLTQMLRMARRAEPVTETHATSWSLLALALDSAWNSLVEPSSGESTSPALSPPDLTGLAQRREQERARWQTTWKSEWKPALEAASLRRDWTTDERRVLADIEGLMDLAALQDVQDDTVWRPEERPAWFRVIERLQTSSRADLQRHSTGVVGFVPLFRQPKQYRGRVVTVRGTAKLAYRVPAARNDLGVADFCLFWVRPQDGTNLPIVIYALEPPAGFPQLTKDQRKIDEVVEVTGYFFKRWAYEAHDGLNSAPLLIAKSPTWLPPPPPPPSATQQLAAALGSWLWPVVVAGVLALAVFAASLAWLANWSSRPSAALASLLSPEQDPEQHAAMLQGLPRTPTVEESLRRLQDEECREA